MNPQVRHRINTALVLVIGLVLTTAIRGALDPVLENAAPFTIFLVAVAAAAWHGGLVPGIAATVGGAAIGSYFFFSPRWSLGVPSEPLYVVRVLVFIVTGVFISILSHARLNANMQLRSIVARLRWMGMELTLAEDRQRRAIAQALHDHLQQLLVAARLKLNGLTRADQDRSVRNTAAQTDNLLDEAISYTRTLTVELSPAILYTDGLIAAVRTLKSQVRDRYNLTLTVDADPDAEPMDQATCVLLFQAVRELLFNVAKHARTDQALVRIRRSGQSIRVVVEDQGIGIRSGCDRGLGLLNIEERLHAIGGSMVVEPADAEGYGTRITLTGPLEPFAPPAGPMAETEPSPVPRIMPTCSKPTGRPDHSGAGPSQPHPM